MTGEAHRPIANLCMQVAATLSVEFQASWRGVWVEGDTAQTRKVRARHGNRERSWEVNLPCQLIPPSPPPLSW